MGFRFHNFWNGTSYYPSVGNVHVFRNTIDIGNTNTALLYEDGSSDFGSLYENRLGNGTLLPVYYSGNLAGTQQKLDFNWDTHPDLLWRDQVTGSNLVWFMQGTNLIGSNYLDAALLPSSWYPGAIADLNGDLKKDLAWRREGLTSIPFWGLSGTNRLESTSLASFDADYALLASGDFNGDGKEDLVFRSSSGTNVLLLMDGTNQLQTVTLPARTGTNFVIAGAADFNRDHQTDILWRDYASGLQDVWLMNGTNYVATVLLSPATLRSSLEKIVAVADFNSDGDPDILWRNFSNGALSLWEMTQTNWTLLPLGHLPLMPPTNWYVAGGPTRHDPVTLYVATNGSDNDPGTLTQPFRTIQKALDSAFAGDSILIRGGTYREDLLVTFAHSGVSNSLVTVQPYENETVVVNAADLVTNWVLHDAASGIWKKANWTTNSQCVFVHSSSSPVPTAIGAPLQQIGVPGTHWDVSTNTITPVGTTNNILSEALRHMTNNAGTFYYDTNNLDLYIRLADSSNPSTKGIEVSVRTSCVRIKPNDWLLGEVGYMHFKNIYFRHSNAQQMGTVVGAGNHCIFENCDIQGGDFGAINLAEYGKAINCNLSLNGNNGVSGTKGVSVIGCTISSNNFRNFHLSWHAGGIKIITYPVAYGEVTGCEVSYNNGVGIWFDWCVSTNPITVLNNFVHHNKTGIAIEASKNALVANNLVVSNVSSSIIISGSDSCRVYNNTVVATQYDSTLYAMNAAIAVGGVPRENVSLTNNFVFNNLIVSNVSGVKGISALKNGHSPANTNSSGVWYTNTVAGNQIDFNAYHDTGAVVFHSPWGGGAGTNFSLAQWRGASGYESNSLEIKPIFAVGSGTDFALANSSPLIDRGTNLVAVTNDFLGTARPLQWFHDIGAFENIGHKEGDFDTNGSIFAIWVKNGSTSSNMVWQMSGTNLLSKLFLENSTNDWDIQTTADLNGDGYTDLLLRRPPSTNLWIWYMNGTNRTGTLFMPFRSTNWTLAASADMNNDGWTDLIWRDYNDGRNLVSFMGWASGAPSILSQGLIYNAATNWDLAGAADFNRDGHPDLLWKATDSTGLRPVALWHMNGTNRIAATTLTDSQSKTIYAAAVGDYNQDGYPDILWHNQTIAPGSVSFWFMNNTNRIGTLGMGTESTTFGGAGPR